MTWIDSWARRAARPRGGSALTSHSQDLAAASLSSRRDFLRRAGVIGSAVWAVPAMQSVLAPAAAVSGPCSQGTCGIGAGCTLCPVGNFCAVSAECLTNICSGGTCQAGGIGTTCATNADCTAGQCSQRGSEAKTCGGPGSTCTGPAGCTNGNCNGATCGGLLATCTTSSDCRTGRNCTNVFGTDRCI